MKKVIFPLICTCMLCKGQATGYGQSTLTINKLDLSDCHMLNEVVEDAVQRLHNDSTAHQISLLMDEYKGGSLVKVVKTNAAALEERDNWEGYVEMNGKIVFIDFGLSKYRPVFVSPSDPLRVDLKRFENNAHILDIKYYYILDDVYAVYTPEEGWIWSDGKPDV